MTAKTTHSDERRVKLDDDLVSQYLQDNPDFFVRHKQLAQILEIPHPVHGAVSLLEWKMTKQSEKITQLQSEITTLMEHASANQKLVEKLIFLQSQLLKATSLTAINDCLDKWAKSFGLMGGLIYLFEDRWQLTDSLDNFPFALHSTKFDEIRVKYLQFNKQYLGALNVAEQALLLPKYADVGSVALCLLGEHGDLGVTVFASHDAKHYQTGQGTLMLEKITEILPLFIRQWVTKR